MSNDAFPIYAESLDALPFHTYMTQCIDAIPQDHLETTIRVIYYIYNSLDAYGTFIADCKRKEPVCHTASRQQIEAYEAFRTKAQQYRIKCMLGYISEKSPMVAAKRFKDML